MNEYELEMECNENKQRIISGIVETIANGGDWVVDHKKPCSYNFTDDVMGNLVFSGEYRAMMIEIARNPTLENANALAELINEAIYDLALTVYTAHYDN